MSLEAALQEHTAVMRELLARLTAGSMTAVTMTGTEYVAKIDAEASEAAAAEAAPAKPTTAKDAVAAAKASAAAAEAKAAEAKPAATEAAALDYATHVRPRLLKVSTAKGRDAVVGLLSKFGVEKGDQLKADQLADALAAANELLGA